MRSDDQDEPSRGVSAITKGNYLPPHLRAHIPDINKKGKDKVCLRVGNLSDDTTEHDLRDLFGNFGYITRVNIVSNNYSTSRNFGYVEFAQHQDALSAQKLLNGYGFANLILDVDFATSKSELSNTTAMNTIYRKNTTR